MWPNCRKLRIWSHLLEKSLMENFSFLCNDESSWHWDYCIEQSVSRDILTYLRLNLILNWIIYWIPISLLKDSFWYLMKYSQSFLLLVFVRSPRWVFISSPIGFHDASSVEKLLPGLTSKIFIKIYIFPFTSRGPQ